MIREFDAESSSHQTVSSATESLSLGIFRASREIARASAFFCSQAVAEKNHFSVDDALFAAEVSISKFGATVWA